MTRDELIALARKAGIVQVVNADRAIGSFESLGRFVALVEDRLAGVIQARVQAEREHWDAATHRQRGDA